MKVYFIYSKSSKDIVFKSSEEADALNFFKEQNLDKKYYRIKEIDSPLVEDWLKGKIVNNELVKELRAAI